MEAYPGAKAGQDSSSTDEQLIAVYYECRSLATQKNEAYRDAWRTQGYMGNLARLQSKVARIRGLMWRDQPDEMAGATAEQAVEAELVDIINMAAYGLLNLRAGNRWGGGNA